MPLLVIATDVRIGNPMTTTAKNQSVRGRANIFSKKLGYFDEHRIHDYPLWDVSICRPGIYPGMALLRDLKNASKCKCSVGLPLLAILKFDTHGHSCNPTKSTKKVSF